MEVSLFTFHLCPPLLKSIDKNFLTTPNYYLILREWQKEKKFGLFLLLCSPTNLLLSIFFVLTPWRVVVWSWCRPIDFHPPR
jgi:hypothetical protein